MITKDNLTNVDKLIFLISCIRNLWRTVKGIYIFIPGLKGLKVKKIKKGIMKDKWSTAAVVLNN